MQQTATGKKTLVLGASENPSRYSNMAVRKLVAHGHPVVAIGNKKGSVGAVQIETKQTVLTDINTVTLYLNPSNQAAYFDYILSFHPKRIIFNPGTENELLMKAADENGIEAVVGCTLVMLGAGNY